MKAKVVLVARILLGLIFLVFGLNGFLHFIPTPQLPEQALNFMMALVHTGYMIPMIKGVEVIGGILLLLNVAAPLMLIILTPNIVNIFLFHALLAPAGLPVPIVIVALTLFLAWSYRDRYAGLFRIK